MGRELIENPPSISWSVGSSWHIFQKTMELFCVLMSNPLKAENWSNMPLIDLSVLGLASEKGRTSSAYIRCVMEFAPFTLYVSNSLSCDFFSISLLSTSIMRSNNRGERGSLCLSPLWFLNGEWVSFLLGLRRKQRICNSK